MQLVPAFKAPLSLVTTNPPPYTHAVTANTLKHSVRSDFGMPHHHQLSSPHPCPTPPKTWAHLEEFCEGGDGGPKAVVVYHLVTQPARHVAEVLLRPKALVRQQHRTIVPAVAYHAPHGLVDCTQPLLHVPANNAQEHLNARMPRHKRPSGAIKHLHAYHAATVQRHHATHLLSWGGT